jgi:delta-aminolevulinic acid dehydratase/porphobilinogen synthase
MPDLYGVHKNTRFKPHVRQRVRPRRNRKSEAIRSMVRETTLAASDLIYPLFIHDDKDRVVIKSMPGCHRHGPASLVQEVTEAVSYGVKAFILFPKIADNLKSVLGEEAYNDNGLIPRTIRMLKKQFPDIILCTDIALDPYSSVGHDGILHDGKILNDETIVQLQLQAISHARAGADIVAPSDMMDGRVGAIRDALDAEGFTETSILGRQQDSCYYYCYVTATNNLYYYNYYSYYYYYHHYSYHYQHTRPNTPPPSTGPSATPWTPTLMRAAGTRSPTSKTPPTAGRRSSRPRSTRPRGPTCCW